MLVDDHPIMRKGLRDVLEDSGAFDVVGEAADGAEAVRTAEESRPDVIVMDVMMPKKNGVEACRDILDLLPDAKVLMLTASTEEDAVTEAIAAGATGFVQKYSGSDELVDTLREVAEGRLMIPDDAVRRVFRLLRSGTVLMPEPKVLTVREREVLTHFAKGKPYARIAEALGVSTATIKSAIYRMQNKLGVESKQEIVVWAVRNGLLDGEEGGYSANAVKGWLGKLPPGRCMYGHQVDEKSSRSHRSFEGNPPQPARGRDAGAHQTDFRVDPSPGAVGS